MNRTHPSKMRIPENPRCENGYCNHTKYNHFSDGNCALTSCGCNKFRNYKIINSLNEKFKDIIE